MLGLLMVVCLHAGAFWILWQHRLVTSPQDVATLFVNFVAPPPKQAPEPRRPPPPKPSVKPEPRQIVATTPVVTPSDYIAPPPPPQPAPEAAIEARPMPLPVALSSELSVACPERPAPAYPPRSRRLNETGTVVLRVELAETGHVAAARIDSSSGHMRLDDAALAAIKTWRCMPALRLGQAVRAVALQPFKFVLQGH
jgi:protein TonB